MFKRNLKKNVKDELMRSDAKFDTIQTLIKIAIDVDDKLYKRAIKNDTINSMKERESSLNQRSIITQRKIISRNITT